MSFYSFDINTIGMTSYISMRTTLDIEPDVLDLAKSFADSRKMSLGKAVSWLARRGAVTSAPLVMRNGFPVFAQSGLKEKFGPDDVRAALDNDDLVIGDAFRSRPGV
jgi:hypothetical protein